MLKVTFAVLAVALAGTAGAAGWRDLRLDASSETAFEESVATFQEKLSPSRRFAFARSLQEIWIHGTKRANDEQREYTSADYFRELDGLRYEEVVRILDPTGEKEKRYRRLEYYARQASPTAPPGFSGGASPPPVENGVYRGYTTNGGIRLESNAGMR